MDRDNIHTPARMQIVLGNDSGDRDLMRRMIEQVMLGQYPDRTAVVRAGLRLLFGIDKEREERGE